MSCQNFIDRNQILDANKCVRSLCQRTAGEKCRDWDRSNKESPWCLTCWWSAISSKVSSLPSLCSDLLCSNSILIWASGFDGTSFKVEDPSHRLTLVFSQLPLSRSKFFVSSDHFFMEMHALGGRKSRHDCAHGRGGSIPWSTLTRPNSRHVTLRSIPSTDQ